MNIDTGGQAFPVTPTDRSGQIAPTEPGMTLRDYFASAAIQGFCTGGTRGDPIFTLTDLAYDVADAMLKSRNGK